MGRKSVKKATKAGPARGLRLPLPKQACRAFVDRRKEQLRRACRGPLKGDRGGAGRTLATVGDGAATRPAVGSHMV